ncbi:MULTISPECIES: hypothetical protein [Staphylococcus]|uniref:Uncharacterized protein n=1 Tax=Staphylococcus equorum TaxID=246432 RepID=A0A9X4L8Z6_9STAP|nr:MULTISPECIES: hypothetical protein [Staphylococcus]KRG09860.1 hypothetical protein ACA31_02995 [Staphylococcus sp. NAM3COL9]MDG0843400.1 hypothetical protein [Staphylococcus equorum]MDG0858711.1 hypothetical protein [Staphylococcus equorum]
MNLKQALKITLLIVNLAEEIKGVGKTKLHIRDLDSYHLKTSSHGIRTIIDEKDGSKVELC